MASGLMPAAVYTGGATIAVEDVPVPDVGSGQVLVEVSHCGICGTDLHLVLENRARPGSILGHEWSGTVAVAGPGADGWQPGDRVVAAPEPACGTCRACRRGRPSSCLRREPPDYLSFRGAFARYVVVDSHRLARLPTGLSTRVAALTEPTAVALHAITLAHLEDGDRILVSGAGPIGLLTTALLRARGFDDVTVVEPSPMRRQRALAVGAPSAIDPRELAVPEMGRTVERPFAVAFECSGHAAAVETALDQLDFVGTLVFVGTGHEPPRINHNRVIMLELTVLGSANYDANGFPAALDALASGALPTDLLIEPTDVPLTGLAAAMGALSRTEIAGKVLVRPEVTA
jgi:(R,R)-butanediol dehydrogenase / meso-butanediol dehydrogenase / diacetyl reductase